MFRRIGPSIAQVARDVMRSHRAAIFERIDQFFLDLSTAGAPDDMLTLDSLHASLMDALRRDFEGGDVQTTLNLHVPADPRGTGN